MEKIKNNLGKIIITMSIIAAIFLGSALFQMFDYRIDYAALIPFSLITASCVLLIVFGFKNEKVEKYLSIPFCLFIGAISVANLILVFDDASWASVFALLFSIAIIVFYVLYRIDGKPIYKDLLFAFLLALSINYFVTIFALANIYALPEFIISIIFILCLMLQSHKKEETQE